jgi:hypothetical protein
MKDRLNLIEEIIHWPDTIQVYKEKMNEYSWDYEWETVILKWSDISSLLSKYLDNKLDYEYLVIWADLIELRDEIEYENKYENIISEIITILSTPEVNWELTIREIEVYIHNLSS